MFHKYNLELTRTFHIMRHFWGYRHFSTTQFLTLNQKWRKQRGLPLNPTASGVITDGADYTFLDGRPTPYGIGQKERILQQRKIAEDIIKLTAEVDFAVARHKQMQLEETERNKRLVENRLKPKGIELLKKKI